MKLKIFALFVLALLFSCNHRALISQTVQLTELSNPHEIIADGTHLIISDGVEGTSIVVYSLKDLSLYSRFGGTGDSIGKFIVSSGHAVGMDIRNDTLLISSHWKTSFFSKKGELYKEKPIKKDTYRYQFMNDYFIGMDDTTVNKIMYYTFNQYDQDLKFIKEITRIAGSNQGKKGLHVLVRKYQGKTYKDKFYLKGKSEDFEIEVFDLDGMKKDVFTNTIERVPVNDRHRNDVLSMYKEHPLFGQYFNAIKKRIVFPEYLPAICNFNIADDFIYVLTYSFDSICTLLHKINLKGKPIDKFNIPLKWKRSTEPYPYTVSKDRLYQIVKNKSQKWELQVVKL